MFCIFYYFSSERRSASFNSKPTSGWRLLAFCSHCSDRSSQPQALLVDVPLLLLLHQDWRHPYQVYSTGLCWSTREAVMQLETLTLKAQKRYSQLLYYYCLLQLSNPNIDQIIRINQIMHIICQTSAFWRVHSIVRNILLYSTIVTSSNVVRVRGLLLLYPAQNSELSQ